MITTREVLTVHKKWKHRLQWSLSFQTFNYQRRRSRGVLPSSLVYGEAVEASRVMSGSRINGRRLKVISSIEKDLFHETYRSSLVPWMEEVQYDYQKNEGLETCGTYLSGAGPTVMTFVHKKEVDRLYKH